MRERDVQRQTKRQIIMGLTVKDLKKMTEKMATQRVLIQRTKEIYILKKKKKNQCNVSQNATKVNYLT